MVHESDLVTKASVWHSLVDFGFRPTASTKSGSIWHPHPESSLPQDQPFFLPHGRDLAERSTATSGFALAGAADTHFKLEKIDQFFRDEIKRWLKNTFPGRGLPSLGDINGFPLPFLLIVHNGNYKKRVLSHHRAAQAMNSIHHQGGKARRGCRTAEFDLKAPSG